MNATAHCPSEEELAAFASGALAQAVRDDVQAHLRQCPDCFALAARVMSPNPSLASQSLGQSPTLPVDPVAPAPLQRGTMLDRYVVLDRLGAGGMGVVYAAYDAELDRKLAVKLLGARASTPEGRARLLREAQAMARLSHENVIAVYDVGTVGEQVFVAMEYVDGATLTAWLSAAPRSVREVIDVFLPAGRALAAAHAAGIVHRDFKPDNVMLGKDGRVRVLDFGLAHATTATESAPADLPSENRSAALATPLTRSGALMGTPLYMSPEQWRQDPADARSDQFSYCVALYEALWGQRPFAGETTVDLARAVLHGEVRPPLAPSAERRVPAWVEKIVLRGLATDPAARFATMDELLSALAADPDAARRRRRRTQLVTGAFCALGALATFGLVRDRHAGAERCQGFAARLAGVWDDGVRRAIRESFGKSGRPYAADSADRVARILDAYTQNWVRTRVDACEATQVRGDQSERLLDLRVGCLDRRLHELGALTQLFSSAADGAVVDKAVSAASQLTSLDGCSDAAALQSVVPPPADAAVRARVETLRGKLGEARALENAGKFDRALELARAADAEAATIAYAPLRAESLERKASLEEKKGDAKSAEHDFDEALKRAAEAHDDVLAAHIWPALLTAVGQDQARYADAQLLYSFAESALERGGDDSQARAAYYDVVGRIAGGQRHLGEQRDMFERALAIRQKTLPPDDPAIASSLNNLGIAYDLEGKYDAALDAYNRALATREKAFGAQHPIIASTLNNIGIVYKEQGRFADAERLYRRALDIDRQVFGAEHPAVAEMLNSLGNVLEREGKVDQAEALHRQALAMREKIFGPMHPAVGISLQNLAIVLHDEKRYDDERALYTRLIALREKVFGADNPLTGEAIENMGDLCVAQHRFADAEKQYRRALAIFEKADGKNHPDLAYPLTGLAIVAVELARAGEAVPLAERALALREAAKAAPMDLGDTRFALARALAASGGDRARALALAKQAQHDFATTPEKKDSSAEVEAWLKTASRSAR